MIKKLVIAVLPLLFSAAVNAETVTLRYVSDAQVVAAAGDLSVFQYTGNLNNGTFNLQNQAEVPSTFVGFCVEPRQARQTFFSDYEKSSLDASDFVAGNGAARYNAVQALFDNIYSSVDTAEEFAAMRVALWEIFDDDQNLATGDIFATAQGASSSVLAIASTYLSGLANWQVNNSYTLDFYSSANNQDYLTATSAVPLPAALPMFLSGLAGLGVMRRRKALA